MDDFVKFVSGLDPKSEEDIYKFSRYTHVYTDIDKLEIDLEKLDMLDDVWLFLFGLFHHRYFEPIISKLKEVPINKLPINCIMNFPKIFVYKNHPEIFFNMIESKCSNDEYNLIMYRTLRSHKSLIYQDLDFFINKYFKGVVNYNKMFDKDRNVLLEHLLYPYYDISEYERLLEFCVHILEKQKVLLGDIENMCSFSAFIVRFKTNKQYKLYYRFRDKLLECIDNNVEGICKDEYFGIDSYLRKMDKNSIELYEHNEPNLSWYIGYMSHYDNLFKFENFNQVLENIDHKIECMKMKY